MKKILMVMLLGIFIWGHPGDSEAQELKRTNIAYFGADYDEGYGVLMGVGFTIGKGSLLPYVRFSENTEPDLEEVIYDRGAGIEFAYWLFSGQEGNWRIGVLGDPANVEWVKLQDQSTDVIVGQAIGVIGTWHFAEKAGLSGWVKIKSQWFDDSEVYGQRPSAGLAVFGEL